MHGPQTTTLLQPSFWARLCAAWDTLLGRHPSPAPGNSQVHSANTELVDTTPSPLDAQPRLQPRNEVQPYNPQALAAAREDWHRGDWSALADITLDQLQDHPDRAKLALFAAVATTKCPQTSRELLKLAEKWGCDKNLIKRMLIASVHKSLSRAASAANLEKSSAAHQAFANSTISIK